MIHNITVFYCIHNQTNAFLVNITDALKTVHTASKMCTSIETCINPYITSKSWFKPSYYCSITMRCHNKKHLTTSDATYKYRSLKQCTIQEYELRICLDNGLKYPVQASTCTKWFFKTICYLNVPHYLKIIYILQEKQVQGQTTTTSTAENHQTTYVLTEKEIYAVFSITRLRRWC